MKSWAVTKGPSFNPGDKRLAVRTEDHPREYNKFEGVIPDRQYGAGPVMIWDEGTWLPDDDPERMEKKGHMTFTLEGGRMKGRWHLVRMRREGKRENWLLIKGADEFALKPNESGKFLRQENTSIVTGRTMAEIIHHADGNTPAGRKRKNKVSSEKAAKAVKKNPPTLDRLLKDFDGIELATLAANPPGGSDWIHEIKYDGYRLMAFIRDGKVILRTRGMKDWTHKFPGLAAALKKIKTESAVLDMEACVSDSHGRTSFSLLQEALSGGRTEGIEGWIFDLLHLDGEDLRALPLVDRKARLERLLKDTEAPLHYSGHFESSPRLLARACKLGAEGLVSKRKDSRYRGRRTREWIKSKCGLAQEFVIGGFMPAKDRDKAVGSLLLGYYNKGRFVYAGKVGTGFSRAVARDVYKKLIVLRAAQSSFTTRPPRGLREYVFVKPQVLCEISFLEWTADGHVRHPSFKGIREDKAPKSVKKEAPVKIVNERPPRTKPEDGLAVAGVTISHPERIVFPGQEITKGDVAEYYGKVAPLMLPYMDGRFISLLRCTDGTQGECFFQRNAMPGMGGNIKARTVTHKGKKHKYIHISDQKGLLQLVQMGTIEFHAWQSRVDAGNKPDQIIFDLDPDEAVPFAAVKLAAQDIRARLKNRGLESFARLSGGKGIHVVVPIHPEHRWDAVKEFARAFAQEMARETPAAYVATMSKQRRKGKIFIDFFRNDFSSTAIVPFSLRARSGASVAWPVAWADLKKIHTADAFRMDKITAAMLKKAARTHQAFAQCRQSLVIPGGER